MIPDISISVNEVRASMDKRNVEHSHLHFNHYDSLVESLDV